MEETIQEIDLVKLVITTINTLFENLFSSIDNAIYPLLDKMVFIQNDIFENTYLEQILGDSAEKGLLILANALLFSILIYYSIKLLFSHFSGTPSESPYRFLIKAILCAILMNCSLFLCTKIVDLTHFISQFICDLGKSLFSKKISFVTITTALNTSLSSNFNIFSIDGLISGLLSFSSLGLLLTFAFRYILVKVLILLSPFAFLCAMDKSTEGFFKGWYKCFLVTLFLQIVVALILLLPYAILKEDSDSLFHKLLLVRFYLCFIKIE